jgi:hypothetical protein
MHLDPTLLLALAGLIWACTSFGAECRRWLKILTPRGAAQRSAKGKGRSIPKQGALNDGHG